MNPSARGWLKKLLKSLEKEQYQSLTLLDFYPKLKLSGFIYGSNVAVVYNFLSSSDYNQEERCKINFTLALYVVYQSHGDFQTDFKNSIISFYEKIGFYKTNFLREIIGSDAESIIHKRIQIDDNVLTKNFNLFATNALLFMDVLAFDQFLSTSKNINAYLLSLENSVQKIVSSALNSKAKKNKYDFSLIKLLEASSRQSKQGYRSYDEIQSKDFSKLETLYLLDLVCMATWSDKQIDNSEQQFLDDFGSKFNLSTSEISSAVDAVNTFYEAYKSDIALLSTKNLATRFYDHSSGMVKKLIVRNSKRLYQELKESQELVMLLSQSTIRDLNQVEQKKMQEQMMDLLKSIPSLAIFMLPGGAFLLPLFIKFIPKLLPSAFDDNRIEDE